MPNWGSKGAKETKLVSKAVLWTARTGLSVAACLEGLLIIDF